jgi:hypothetical protein
LIGHQPELGRHDPRGARIWIQTPVSCPPVCRKKAVSWVDGRKLVHEFGWKAMRVPIAEGVRDQLTIDRRRPFSILSFKTNALATTERSGALALIGVERTLWFGTSRHDRDSPSAPLSPGRGSGALYLFRASLTLATLRREVDDRGRWASVPEQPRDRVAHCPRAVDISGGNELG